MSYTKDYYAILNLPLPQQPASTAPTPTASIRRAYKLALLAAHPDKHSGQARSSTHTVDDVKEAYTILIDPDTRRTYDEWIRRSGGIVGGCLRGNEGQVSQEFLAGLEVLDLSDFCVLDPGFEFTDAEGQGGGGGEEEREGEGEGEGEAQMEWTRACRCGDENGFRILEDELEDAERRGEGEVLVGCGGCSLWVRVGFGREGD